MHGMAKPVWKDEKNKRDGYETQQSSTDSTLNTGPWLQSWWSQHRYQNSMNFSAKPCWWICFSRRFKLQLTADLRSVYSSFFKHVLYQSDKMLGATCTSCFYCFSWYTAGPHPNHLPVSVIRSDILANMELVWLGRDNVGFWGVAMG